MRKSIIFILLLSLIYSCEKTNSPQTDYYKMIGAVDFKLQRTHESARVLGTFNCSYYLADTKVELLHNDKVVETTYTIPDTAIDILYLLKKLELNTAYRIRIELNSEMADTSDEFMITEDAIRILSDSLTSELTEQLSWFEPGEYYWDYNFNNLKDLSFDLYTGTQELNVYPNPVTTNAFISFYVTNSDTINLEILDLKLNTVVSIYNEINNPGINSIEIITEDMVDGLYIIRYTTSEKSYYCPFLVGRKGAPPIP